MLALLLADGALGAFVVLTNRGKQAVQFSIEVGGKPQDRSLEAGEVVPLRVDAVVQITVRTKAGNKKFTLDPNSIYYFAEDPLGQTTFQRIGVGRDHATDEPPAKGAAGQPQKTQPLAVIPVKILVDEEERANTEAWQKRLRERVEAASATIERHCFVRFKVVAYGTWKSNDRVNEFPKSLAEFEEEAEAKPARLAIGFTSQYQLVKGRTHLGGTRGPLHTHLLVREWSQHITEPERLEVLMHELGHFLGAVHSPEPNSVMRIVLGDRQARAAKFRIGFDPVNTLAMCLMGDDLRSRPWATVKELRMSTQLELRMIYADMARVLPEDPAAPRYLRIIDQARLAPLAEGARSIVQMIVMAGERNMSYPEPATPPVPGLIYREVGDELAEMYVRQTAAAAKRLKDKTAGQAYLVGLALGLDRSRAARQDPVIGVVAQTIESEEQRKLRLRLLGEPTARGKLKLLEQFTLAAALTTVVGASGAESGSLFKERASAQAGAKFDFANYEAALAGSAFSIRLTKGELTLARVAEEFTFEKFLPAPDGLPQPVSWPEFEKNYGSFTDPRFVKVRSEMLRRIGPTHGAAGESNSSEPKPPAAKNNQKAAAQGAK